MVCVDKTKTIYRLKTNIKLENIDPRKLKMYLPMKNKNNKDIFSLLKENDKTFINWLCGKITGLPAKPYPLETILENYNSMQMFQMCDMFLSRLLETKNVSKFLEDIYHKSPQMQADYSWFSALSHEVDTPGVKLPGTGYDLASAILDYNEHRGGTLFRRNFMSQRLLVKLRQTYPLDFVGVMGKDMNQVATEMYSAEDIGMIRENIKEKCGVIEKLIDAEPEYILELMTKYGIVGVTGALSLLSTGPDSKNYAIFHYSIPNKVSPNYKPGVIMISILILVWDRIKMNKRAQFNILDSCYSYGLSAITPDNDFKDLGYWMIDSIIIECMCPAFSHYSRTVHIKRSYMRSGLNLLLAIALGYIFTSQQRTDKYKEYIDSDRKLPPQCRRLPINATNMERLLVSMSTLIATFAMDIRLENSILEREKNSTPWRSFEVTNYRFGQAAESDYLKFAGPVIRSHKIKDILDQEEITIPDCIDEYRKTDFMNRKFLSSCKTHLINIIRGIVGDENPLSEMLATQSFSLDYGNMILAEIESSTVVFSKKSEELDWRTVKSRYDRFGDQVNFALGVTKPGFTVKYVKSFDHPQFRYPITISHYIENILPVVMELESSAEMYDTIEEYEEDEGPIEMETSKDITIFTKTIRDSEKSIRAIPVSFYFINMGDERTLYSIPFDRNALKLICFNYPENKVFKHIFLGRSARVKPMRNNFLHKYDRPTFRWFLYAHETIDFKTACSALRLTRMNLLKEEDRFNQDHNIDSDKMIMGVEGEVTKASDVEKLNDADIMKEKEKVEKFISDSYKTKTVAEKEATKDIPIHTLREQAREQLYKLGFKDKRDVDFLEIMYKDEILDFNLLIKTTFMKWKNQMGKIKDLLKKINENPITTLQMKRMLMVPRCFEEEVESSTTSTKSPILDKSFKAEFDMIHPTFLMRILSGCFTMSVLSKQNLRRGVDRLYRDCQRIKPSLSAEDKKCITGIVYFTDIMHLALNNVSTVVETNNETQAFTDTVISVILELTDMIEKKSIITDAMLEGAPSSYGRLIAGEPLRPVFEPYDYDADEEEE